MNRMIPAILCALTIAWIIIQANLGNKLAVFHLVSSIPLGDKISHMLLFGFLSGLTIIAFQYKLFIFKKIEIPVGALIVFLFASLEEISQLFFINRTFELLDLFADIIGIYLSILILNRYKMMSKNK